MSDDITSNTGVMGMAGRAVQKLRFNRINIYLVPFGMFFGIPYEQV